MKTFSSVLRFGVSGLRRKRIENAPNRIENVEGQKARKRKKRFLRFRLEARKDHENVKKRFQNVLKTFPSVVPPGCVENVMKTLKTVLKTLRGPHHGNAKNVFYVFVPRPKKNTET